MNDGLPTATLSTDKEVFKNFDDAAAEEIEARVVSFTIGGEDFSCDLNVNAGEILTWMRSGSKIEGVPLILETFLSEEDFERILETKATWAAMEELIKWLMGELGGQGN